MQTDNNKCCSQWKVSVLKSIKFEVPISKIQHLSEIAFHIYFVIKCATFSSEEAMKSQWGHAGTSDSGWIRSLASVS